MTKIAIVVSQFNQTITNKLLEGAICKLEALGIDKKNMAITKVPGAIEIPLIAKRYAIQKEIKAVICLGAVIRGETSHYDFVCQQVSFGCQQVALDTDTPIIFGILTTETVEQALDRIGGKHGHKGEDAAFTAVEMITLG